MENKDRLILRGYSDPLSNAVRIDFPKAFSGVVEALLRSNNHKFERNLHGSVGVLLIPEKDGEQYEITIRTPCNVWSEENYEQIQISPILIGE